MLSLESITPEELEKITEGPEVFVAVVKDWYNGDKWKAVLLQKAKVYWHTAYNHDQTFEIEDVIEMFRVKVEE